MLKKSTVEFWGLVSRIEKESIKGITVFKIFIQGGLLSDKGSEICFKLTRQRSCKT